MMDTVLNLGLNEETVTGLAEQTGDLRSRWMLIVALLHCSVKS